MPRRIVSLVGFSAVALLLMSVAAPTRRRSDPAVSRFRSGTAISAKNVARLRPLWRSTIQATCDGSPLFVAGVLTPTSVHNLLVVETIEGQLVALDAGDGSLVWQTHAPAGARWTTSSPAIDPARQSVFAYTLDGFIHRYDLSTGGEMVGHGFPALVTRKGDVEKGSSNLSIATAANGRTYLYMTTSGYPDPGDAGDYQGHLVTIDIASGAQHVFNALCSDRAIHFSASGADDCADVQAGIWGRAGAVYDPVTDRVFISTGNGPNDLVNDGFNWGTSVIALRPDGTADHGTPLDSYTPVDYQALTDEDLDLGSTTVIPLPVLHHASWPRLGVQTGKDSRLRLLDLADLSGQSEPRHLGGELQILDLPQQGEVMTEPAPWLDPSGNTWVFVSNGQGTTAYIVSGDATPKLLQKWTSSIPGSTPLIVNGMLYLMSPHHLVALNPVSGAVAWQDQTVGDTHWQSPIVVNDRLYAADNTNAVMAWSINGR